MEGWQGLVEAFCLESGEHVGEAAELPGGFESLCRGMGDVDSNRVLDKGVEAVVAVWTGIDHGFAADGPDGPGEYGGRVVVGEIAAYHLDIICDEGGFGKYLVVKLLEDKGVLTAADDPGTVDESTTVRGDGNIGVKSIGR